MPTIRRAQPRDAETIARMAAEASREDGLPPPALDADLVRAHGFGVTPLFESWIAEEKPGQPIGAAIAYKGYDIHAAVATLVVASLYVRPEARGDGMARCIIAEIAARAMELGVRELTITTGIDNDTAQRFFASIGADRREATTYTLGRDQIEWLAEERA